MKPDLKSIGWKAMAFISLSVVLSSCTEGSDLPSERKKMPRFYGTSLSSNNDYLETRKYSSCGMDFEADLVYINGEKNTDQYFSIPLNDESTDDSLLKMLDTFRPLVSMYLAQWAKTQQKGIMLDLRSNRQKMGAREDYSLEKQNTFAVPVIILWDATTAFRAEKFKAQLDNLPGVSYRKIVKENTSF